MESACIYRLENCNVTANSIEHTIPKMFFNEAFEGTREYIKVPVCSKCNQQAAKIQEQVRIWFGILSSDKNQNAKSLILNNVKRSFQRKRSLHTIIDDKFSLVDVKSPNGIYLGTATQVTPTEQDFENIAKFLDLVVRALSYEMHSYDIPDDFHIEHRIGFSHYLRPTDNFVNIYNKVKNETVYRSVHPDVFASKSGFVEGKTAGIFITEFYKVLTFASFVFHPNHASKMKKTPYRILNT